MLSLGLTNPRGGDTEALRSLCAALKHRREYFSVGSKLTIMRGWDFVAVPQLLARQQSLFA